MRSSSPVSSRVITFGEAIREATDQVLAADPSVFLIGEGVPDPKTIFGTTKGLQEKYGPKRVMDMPVSENGLTGVLIGSAVTGMRPILTHQRVDFSLYAMDQVVNNAAKWFSMFGGKSSCPLVIRMIVGRGWGQGNQHSQNLQSLYAHIPGLKVVVPSNAYAAKGLFVKSVRDNNPVIFLENRWLHNTTSHVPEELYELPLDQADCPREGNDLTIVSWSLMTLEVLKACEFLQEEGVNAEVINLNALSPLDFARIKTSVAKTKRLLVADDSWRHGGMAGEIIARVAEEMGSALAANPQRVTYPDFPSPSTPALTKYYYPSLLDVMKTAGKLMKRTLSLDKAQAYCDTRTHDVPDKNFKGPF